jgi:hypothetical protein
VAKEKKKRFLSLATVLASFFGAAMIAGAFAYFNYKFAEYKFIDFKKMLFYEKKEIFTPKADKYVVIFYSSKDKNTQQLLSKTNLNIPILAIDYYNNAFENTNHVTFLRAGTKTSLSFIQRFNIYNSPSIFFIKKSKDSIYKQDSMIRKLDNLEQLSKEIKNL